MKKLEDFLMPTQKELFSKFAERLRLCWWLTSTRFTRPL